MEQDNFSILFHLLQTDKYVLILQTFVNDVSLTTNKAKDDKEGKLKKCQAFYWYNNIRYSLKTYGEYDAFF